MTNLARSVNAAPLSLRDRFGEVQARIAQAARRSGRDPGQVLLIGAVKSVPIDRIQEARALGLADLGENRVQEATRAIAALGRGARWHMIGHLQRNKVGRAVELFDRVHSVDDLELARALSRHAQERGRTIAVLVQVNVSGEVQKHGVDTHSLPELIAGVARLPGLTLDGLMSIGAAEDRAQDAQRAFARTRELRDQCVASTGVTLRELSMGMSDDFEWAIAEGSTMVRIGRALFGSRA